MNVQTIMMASTVVMAFATVIYATLTYFLLREQRREKEKPRIQEIVDVVICPLIKKLEEQKGSFKKGDFKWTQDGFYYLRHKLEPPHGAEMLIYEEFKKVFPEIDNEIIKYNAELMKQEETLDAFADEIVLLPDYQKKVSELFERYKKERKTSDTFFESNTKNLEYILGDIVNNKHKLNSSNAYYDFWNLYKEDLLKFREREEIMGSISEVEIGTKNLLALSERILKRLRDIMNRYRRQFGIVYNRAL